MEVALDLRVLPGETRLIITDIMHRHARGVAEHFRGHGVRPAGLAGQHDAVGRDHRFAGDAGVRVGGQERVEHGVADPVRDLVGMAFRDGFGSE